MMLLFFFLVESTITTLNPFLDIYHDKSKMMITFYLLKIFRTKNLNIYLKNKRKANRPKSHNIINK